MTQLADALPSLPAARLLGNLTNRFPQFQYTAETGKLGLARISVTGNTESPIDRLTMQLIKSFVEGFLAGGG